MQKCFLSPGNAMGVVGVMWVTVVAACGGVAAAEEEDVRTTAVWWRAPGEDLLRAWARQEEANSVTLVLLTDGDAGEAVAWADTVRIMAIHLTTSEDPWVCRIASLPSLAPWQVDGGTLLVAPLFTQRHAYVLSQVIGSSGQQMRRWLLFGGPGYEDLMDSLFLPINNQVVVAQLGQVVQLWDQYQVARGLKRHLHLRGTWTPLQDRVGSGDNKVKGGTLKLLEVPPRLYDLTGLHIRCLAEEWPPFTVLETDGGETRLRGALYELWTILQRRLNFTYDLHSSPDGEWGVLTPDGVWTGMIGELVRGAADVIVGNVDQSSERSRAIDFTVPIIHSTFRLLARKPLIPIGGWSGYSMEFTAGSWAGLLITACVCSLVLILVLRVASRERYAVQEAILIVFGCLCQQGPVREEARWSVRLVLLTMAVFGVLCVTHYSSVMISFLTLTRTSHPITSMQDLLHSSTYMLGIVRGTSTHDIVQVSQRELYRQVWTKLLAPRPDSFVATNAEGVQRAINEDYVFLIDEAIYLYKYTRDCRLTLVGPKYLTMPSSLAFRKNLPYKHIFNHELRSMMEMGVLDREIQQKQTRATCETESITPIGLQNIFTALLLLGTGLLLALLILLMEKLLFHCRHKTRDAQTTLTAETKYLDAGKWHRTTTSSNRNLELPSIFPQTGHNAKRKEEN